MRFRLRLYYVGDEMDLDGLMDSIIWPMVSWVVSRAVNDMIKMNIRSMVLGYIAEGVMDEVK
jgi:hypothetical protein